MSQTIKTPVSIANPKWNDRGGRLCWNSAIGEYQISSAYGSKWNCWLDRPDDGYKESVWSDCEAIESAKEKCWEHFLGEISADQDDRIAALEAERDEYKTAAEVEAHAGDEARAELATLTATNEALQAKLVAVREIVINHVSGAVHARDDHSQNCRWCKVWEIVKETSNA